MASDTINQWWLFVLMGWKLEFSTSQLIGFMSNYMILNFAFTYGSGLFALFIFPDFLFQFLRVIACNSGTQMRVRDSSATRIFF